MWPWAPPSGPSAGMSSPGALARLEALRSECEWKPLPSSLLRTSFVRSIAGPGLPQRQHEQIAGASLGSRIEGGMFQTFALPEAPRSRDDTCLPVDDNIRAAHIR